MRTMHLVPTKGGWNLIEGGAKDGKLVTWGKTKKEALQRALETIKPASKSTPISLKIHLKNGRISEERTYPRSADPKSSKG